MKDPSPLITKTIKFIIILFTIFDVVREIEALSSSLTNKDQLQRPYRIGVIGGGASGIFAATNAASTLKEHLNSRKFEVHVYESTSKLMSKVLISGGGRCNVLHDTTKPLPKILSSYPRGSRELNGIYSKYFTPDDALEWFVNRGVVLKTESDGRMFPVTDSSQTIIDCIYKDAMKNGVTVKKVIGLLRFRKWIRTMAIPTYLISLLKRVKRVGREIITSTIVLLWQLEVCQRGMKLLRN